MSVLTTKRVRELYGAAVRWDSDERTASIRESNLAEFDAWIAAHDREVRARAYETLAADPHHGWAIATLLIDMAAVERGQMTQVEMDKKWGVDR